MRKVRQYCAWWMRAAWTECNRSIEPLACRHERAILSDAEFATEKAELVARQ